MVENCQEPIRGHFFFPVTNDCGFRPTEVWRIVSSNINNESVEQVYQICIKGVSNACVSNLFDTYLIHIFETYLIHI